MPSRTSDPRRTAAAAFALAVLTASTAVAAEDRSTITYESHRMPVQGLQQVFTAQRPHLAVAVRARPAVGAGANPWRFRPATPAALQ